MSPIYTAPPALSRDRIAYNAVEAGPLTIIRDSRLTFGARAVWLWLADRPEPDGWTAAQIVAAAGSTVDEVYELLGELEDAALIHAVPS